MKKKVCKKSMDKLTNIHEKQSLISAWMTNP